jgi:hypothetical protein
VSLLCVAQHANLQLVCCANLTRQTFLRLRVDSFFLALTCTALGPNRRFSSDFAFWALKPKFENRCGVFLCPDNRVCLRGHVGTTRRAQRRRISSFPFVGPQDQTVNARDRRRRAFCAGTTKASPRRRLFTASHNGPITEHCQVSLEHTRPRCTQICRKFATKEWSLRVELYTEIFYSTSAAPR